MTEPKTTAIQNAVAVLQQSAIDKVASMPMGELMAFLGLTPSTAPPAYVSESPPPPAPVARRRPGRSDPEQVLDLITAQLREHPEGIRLEKLRAETGQDKPDLVKAIKMGLEKKRLIKTGEKRATTYFLPRPGTGVGAVIRRPAR